MLFIIVVLYYLYLCNNCYKKSMINQVKLSPEYWHGLTFCAEELGYKSRQELIEAVLVKFMEQYPEELAKGREKMYLIERAKSIGIKAAEPIVPVFMKKGIPVDRFTRMKVYFTDPDRKPEVVVAYSPMQAYFKVFGKYPQNNEMTEKLAKWEFIDE